MKKLKSIGAFAAAAVMSLSALSAPLEVFAEMELPAGIAENTDIVTAGGTFGDNIYWEVSGDTLTVSGNGIIEDSHSEDSPPWNAYSSSITKIIIKDGVTALGEGAFVMFSDVTDFVVADSVVSIDRYAIPYGPWLDEKMETETLVTAGRVLIDASKATGDVVIPDGIKGIGYYAFSNTEGVKSILVPESVEHLDECALALLSDYTVKVIMLNPECVIEPGYAGSTFPSDSTVYCYYGSTAYDYIQNDPYCTDIGYCFLNDDAFLNGSEFTIGGESFKAYASYTLDIYNSRGLALLYQLGKDVAADSEYVHLSVEGNTLTIRDYDNLLRPLHVTKYVYNSSTGKFGSADTSECDRYHFSTGGKDFYAELTQDYKEREVDGYTEYDQYNYLNIYFADGTPTNIQNKVVFIEYGRTGGFGGYCVPSFVEASDSLITVRSIEDFYTDAYDILTSYKYDAAGRKFIEIDATGDIDLNAEVNISDASAILSMYAGFAADLDMSSITNRMYNAADINIDGMVTLEDATYVLTYYAQNAAGMNPVWEELCIERQDIPYSCPGTAVDDRTNKWASLMSVYTLDTDGDGDKETVAKYSNSYPDDYGFVGFFRIYDNSGQHTDVPLDFVGASSESHSAIIRDPDTEELIFVTFINGCSNAAYGISMYRNTLDSTGENTETLLAEIMAINENNVTTSYFKKHGQKCTRSEAYSYFKNIEIIEEDFDNSYGWLEDVLADAYDSVK